MDADVQDLGPTPAGHRRIVVVKGGRFEGPRLRGDVLPGGGAWLVERSDGSRRLDVRLTLRVGDRKSTRLNSSHGYISYAVFCLKKKNRPIPCGSACGAFELIAPPGGL